ncbi:MULTISPECIES: hypothetical protein [unclassified Flavobacterium]|uniref:hypothetical protein n=1 Tax=unclassified Flavobacterium TaxID=196869 RepID=UPI00106663B4|nr:MULTISPECIES: hypothetical protein [unclassified Flavobacterium]TDX08351.1 hypothetical protein EDB96_4282 [Flavobacterium sp. S87F.05.LMB.W.Kidney.N]BDU26576.1 hypothetical protein FLGSB24_33200 [Flavobacterium sp. GSB-24]
MKTLKIIGNRVFAFKISLFYVGLGTLSVCSIYPKDLFYGSWSLFGLIITFPVSIVSFGYRYANADLLYPVFLIQLIMLFPTFLILSRFIKK